jgi:hypothetical protein
MVVIRTRVSETTRCMDGSTESAYAEQHQGLRLLPSLFHHVLRWEPFLPTRTMAETSDPMVTLLTGAGFCRSQKDREAERKLGDSDHEQNGQILVGIRIG